MIVARCTLHVLCHGEITWKITTIYFCVCVCVCVCVCIYIYSDSSSTERARHAFSIRVTQPRIADSPKNDELLRRGTFFRARDSEIFFSFLLLFLASLSALNFWQQKEREREKYGICPRGPFSLLSHLPLHSFIPRVKTRLCFDPNRTNGSYFFTFTGVPQRSLNSLPFRIVLLVRRY